MDGPLLRVEDVRRTYPMGELEVRALDGCSLDVPAGEFLVLLGPSGSGKSTLLNLMGGIDEPSEGQVLYRGQPLAGEATLEAHRRERVGFVFQFYNLIPTLTALENVEMATLIAPDPVPPAEALERVGLASRADHFPSQLSGGEQQRVSIARALAKRPSLLLCDEPTGALDLDTGRRILALLHAINRETGTTVILVTHNGALAKMADRVVSIRSGKIAEDRRIEDPIAPEEVTW